MRKIDVWLKETSDPISHNAISSYTKGGLYCVHLEDDKVVKYPIQDIFRVVEDYGLHSNTVRKDK